MKIQTRLIGAFAAVALILAIVGFVGWRGISNLDHTVDDLSKNNIPELEGLGQMSTFLNASKAGERTILDRELPTKEREKEITKIADRMEKIEEGFKQWKACEKEPSELAMADTMRRELDEWKGSHDKLISLAKSLRGEGNPGDEAIFVQMHALAYGELRTTFSTIESELAKLQEECVKNSTALGVEADKQGQNAITIALISILIGIIAALSLGYIIARQITLPMLKGVNFAEEIAKGIFTSRLKLNRQDEIGQLTNSLDHMAESLARQVEVARTIAGGDLTVKIELSSPQDTLGQALQTMQQGLAVTITQTKLAGNEIANGSLQIADSSQSLAQGASEQASSLEEISSAMTEMSSQTKMTADNALKAQELSNAASAAADNGNHQMQQMVEAMEEIRVASQSVANVIKVIEEIAFQTNMLALNAAVEAAHAGQHGKGFAVVAEEVRNLAARSAKAAKETADLIAGSVAKTEHGAKIADQTAAALGEITERIAQASQLVRSIAEAAREQSQGIDQVSQGLHQIDQVTQQNSANAEEGAAASEELSGQASQLNQLMQAFKVDSGNTVINPSQQMARPGKSAGGMKRPKQLGMAPKAARPTHDTNANPSTLIPLDDAEFGKY
ncbi:MAG: HAMP domain-containing protein [Desulfobulbaceae bacterium]|nr:HAMP domain-containing protein [Desulfobulbaceae bacterium]